MISLLKTSQAHRHCPLKGVIHSQIISKAEIWKPLKYLCTKKILVNIFTNKGWWMPSNMFDMLWTESHHNKTMGFQSLETALGAGHLHWTPSSPVWLEVREPGIVWKGRLARWTEPDHHRPVQVSLGIWVWFSSTMGTGVWVSPYVLVQWDSHSGMLPLWCGKETEGGLWGRYCNN